MVAIIQLAIASGATVGGLVFDLSGYRATFELSATVLGVAAVFAFNELFCHGDRGKLLRGFSIDCAS
ncbi:putative MFS family arabinose efflux permease [Pseudomonas sp. F-14 TE3482]|jgi:predicted MFS family arabinose efflux permease